MRSAGSREVVDAIDAMLAALKPHLDRDWHVSAGSLDWSCHETGAHLAHVQAKYAAQLSGQHADHYLPFDLVLRAGATPADVLDVVNACGRLLAAALDSADPATCAWHYGMTDPEGFAAMGIGEVSVHTEDIARGLGLRWRPPNDLAFVVLRRLLGNAPDGDPTDVLLWATGRGELPGEPPVTNWVWTPAIG